MTKIAEKLEFMRGRAVKVCAKAGVGRSQGHKKTCFCVNFQKICLEKKFLDRPK